MLHLSNHKGKLNLKSWAENGRVAKAGMKELVSQNEFNNCYENTRGRNETNGRNKFLQSLHPSIVCMMFTGTSENAPEPQEFPAHFGDICRCDVGCDTPGLNMLDRFACVKSFQKIPWFEVHELQMVFEQLR